jgi:hypothetical protein
MGLLQYGFKFVENSLPPTLKLAGQDKNSERRGCLSAEMEINIVFDDLISVLCTQHEITFQNWRL